MPACLAKTIVVGSSICGGFCGLVEGKGGRVNWRNCGGNYWDLSWQIHTFDKRKVW
jgi:hypothetical protein